MSWTDERVNVLKKLWAEGHSASQIAKQLGGVTRNAVIGKVHRLGLSGRATPSRPVKRPPRLARPKPRLMPIKAAVAIDLMFCSLISFLLIKAYWEQRPT